MSVTIQVILVIVILIAMIVLLLGIGHIETRKYDADQECVDKLRDDVENRPEVISDESIFHGLVARSEATHPRENK